MIVETINELQTELFWSELEEDPELLDNIKGIKLELKASISSDDNLKVELKIQETLLGLHRRIFMNKGISSKSYIFIYANFSYYNLSGDQNCTLVCKTDSTVSLSLIKENKQISIIKIALRLNITKFKNDVSFKYYEI